MKILVTGGAGFIGHHVVKQLEDAEHEVAILDHCVHNLEFKDERLAFVKAKLYKTHIQDNIARTHINLFQPEVIVHLASAPNARAVNMDPAAATQSMVTGLENMLLAAGRNNVKRFVYISSSMVYGNFTDNVRERFNCSPTTLYGTLKLAGEQMVQLYAERYGFEYVIVRPSAVYGPFDNSDRVIGKFFEAAMAGEDLHVKGIDERLDFTYVDDIASGIVLATSQGNDSGIYNMTYGYSQRIKDAADYVVNITGSRSRVLVEPKDENMPSRGSLNISKAKDMLGYQPLTPLHKGLESYYEFLKRRPCTV